MPNTRSITLHPPIRRQDAWGSGEFGASRGSSRIHKGVDFACAAETQVCAVSKGKCTKIGFPYDNSTSYTYVEITTANGDRERYFYVESIVAVGDEVDKGAVIGWVQDLTGRYPNITNHVHFEIIRGTDYLHPLDYLGGYL